ncbi:MAG: ABC transporter substrate-binding protein [Clostridia bacterium]|nr:ABC transporter substrate-binding protein [Clostridia bacterium]
MKNTKLLALTLALVMALSLFVFASCANENPNVNANETKGKTKQEETQAETKEEVKEEKPESIRVITLAGPTGMGMAKLMDDDTNNKTAYNYEFTVSSAPDQVSPEIIKGNYDIAAVPVNLASVLYNKTEGKLQVAGINTLGVLYMLENGNTINSVADLKGKTIYATGQGSNPEYVLRYILTKNNIDPDKDVTIEFLAEHAELATKLKNNSVAIGMLPEPQVTAATTGSQVRIALDLTKEWDKVSEDKLVQGCIVVRKEFADKYPTALAKFLEEYKNSVDFVNNNVDEASALIEKAGIIPKAAVAKKAIPNCNICLITGDEMKSSVSQMLKVLFDANAASVGGKLPDDEFYH